MFGPTTQSTVPIKSREGTLLTDKTDIQKRWTEHFDTLLNRPSTIDQSAIDEMEQRPMVDKLAEPPTEKEVAEAIQKLQPNKAPGPDGISPEVYKREDLSY